MTLTRPVGNETAPKFQCAITNLSPDYISNAVKKLLSASLLHSRTTVHLQYVFHKHVFIANVNIAYKAYIYCRGVSIKTCKKITCFPIPSACSLFCRHVAYPSSFCGLPHLAIDTANDTSTSKMICCSRCIPCVAAVYYDSCCSLAGGLKG